MRVLPVLFACCVSFTAFAQQTLRTSSFPGVDVGAQIVAADHQLGPAAGIIVVDRGGESSTPVHLGKGHALQFVDTVTFHERLRMSGDNALSCVPGKGKLVLALANNHGEAGLFITAEQVANVSVEHCSITTTNPGNDYVFLDANGSSHIQIVDNRSDQVPLLFSNSVAKSYAGTTAQNMSSDIVFDHNTVTLTAPGYNGHQATGALIFFSRNVKITHNAFHGGAHGVQYWGGNGNFDWKSEASPRWLQNLEISDNDCSDVRGSCYWGAMGQDVQFLRNRAARCGDACLDIEDNKNVTADGNTITDGGNGEVALLGRNVNINITHNQLISTTAKTNFFTQFNNSVDAANAPNITVANNTMVCRDPESNCAVKYQNASNFVFANNQVTNGEFGPGTVWQKGTTVSGNTFTYTRSAAQKFYAIHPAAQILGNTAKITGNTVLSNAPQPAGSECIHIDSGPPQFAPGRFLVQNNVCGGSAPFAVSLNLINLGQTGGAVFTVRENQFAGQIVHDDPGHNGHFDIQR